LPKVTTPKIEPPILAKANNTAVRVALANLQNKAEQVSFATELRKEKAVAFDVPAPDNAKAVDRLNKAFEKQGIKLLVDAQGEGRSQEEAEYPVCRLRGKLRPEELAGILQQLGMKNSRSPLAPWTLRSKRLSDAAECGPASAIVAAARRDHGSAPNRRAGQKDLFKETFIEGAGHDPRKGPATASPSKAPDRFAVVLAATDGHANPATSPEIQRFLSNSPASAAGNLAGVFVVHQA